MQLLRCTARGARRGRCAQVPIGAGTTGIRAGRDSVHPGARATQFLRFCERQASIRCPLRPLNQRYEGSLLDSAAMFHVLIDTSVWLKLAEDHKLTPLLQVVRGLVSSKKMRLVVPRLVVDEFKRNRERVAKTASRSFTSQVNEVRKAITKVGGDQKTTKLVLKHLDEVNHKLPKLGMPADDTFGTIEELFAEANVIEASESVMARAAGRQLDRKAPCHQNKISIADAVIFETFLDASKSSVAGGSVRLCDR